MFGKRTTLKVEGMTCDNCAHHVEKAVAGVHGAKGVKVDLEKGELSFKGTPDLSALRAAVAEAGYKVR